MTRISTPAGSRHRSTSNNSLQQAVQLIQRLLPSPRPQGNILRSVRHTAVAADAPSGVWDGGILRSSVQLLTLPGVCMNAE